LVIIEIGYAVNQTEAFSIAARGFGFAYGFCHVPRDPENSAATAPALASIDSCCNQLTYPCCEALSLTRCPALPH
jgi:hypothetical protein